MFHTHYYLETAENHTQSLCSTILVHIYTYSLQYRGSGQAKEITNSWDST